MRAEIGFLLVDLDVESVALTIQLPVHVPKRIPRHVLAMLGELHAEPVVRALVESGHEPLHHELGNHVQPVELGEDLWI